MFLLSHLLYSFIYIYLHIVTLIAVRAMGIAFDAFSKH